MIIMISIEVEPWPRLTQPWLWEVWKAIPSCRKSVLTLKAESLTMRKCGMCDGDLCTFILRWNPPGATVSSGHASLLGNAASPCPPVKSELLNALRWWESNYQQLKCFETWWDVSTTFLLIVHNVHLHLFQTYTPRLLGVMYSWWDLTKGVSCYTRKVDSILHLFRNICIRVRS